MDLKKVPVGKNTPYDVNVIIEIPMGGNPVKYKLDSRRHAVHPAARGSSFPSVP
jgi:inorganic pyrophosphatase